MTAGAANSALPAAGRPHFRALDGVRGIAILIVMVFHFGTGYEPQNEVAVWVRRLAGAGWTGVDLFFVLSGFLITGILYDTKQDEGYFRKFYARRTLRIFPLYYAALLGVFVVAPWIMTLGEGDRRLQENQGYFWAYLTNLLAWLKGTRATVGDTFSFTHFWTLAVEEHFYLFWPLLVYLLSYRRLVLVLGAMLAGTWLLRMGLWVADWNGAMVLDPVATYCLTPCRIDTLALGALLALATRGGWDVYRLRPWGWRALAVTLPAILAILVYRQGFEGTDPWVQLAGFNLVALASAGFLVVALSSTRTSALGAVVQSNALVALGKISYGVYVFHGLLWPLYDKYFKIPELTQWFARWPGFDEWPYLSACLAYLLLASALSVLAAAVSWQVYEKHLLALKRHFDYADAGKDGPAAAGPDPTTTITTTGRSDIR